MMCDNQRIVSHVVCVHLCTCAHLCTGGGAWWNKGFRTEGLKILPNSGQPITDQPQPLPFESGWFMERDVKMSNKLTHTHLSSCMLFRRPLATGEDIAFKNNSKQSCA